MKLSLSPTLTIAFLLCVLGIGTVLISDSGPLSLQKHSQLNPRFDFRSGLVSSAEITRSSRKREMTKRKAYFPFDDPDVLGQARYQKFLKDTPKVGEIFSQRSDLRNSSALLKAQGIGAKHPGLLETREKMTALEDQVREAWKDFQDRNLLSERERRRDRGR